MAGFARWSGARACGKRVHSSRLPHNSGFLKPPRHAMSELLPTIEVSTSPAPLFAVIWLHGLGADASDFVSVVSVLGLESAPGVRFVFPHAPQIPVTCNGGAVMRAWYDILAIGRNTRKIDEPGLLQSRAAVRRLIARENERGIPTCRIFLAGFSQGGALAYATGLTHAEPVAGIVALSTYLPASETVMREAAQARHRVPVFAAHGTEDDVVAPEMGEEARDSLVRWGYQPEWQTFPMPHSVSIGEIRAIGTWLRARLTAASD